jgi:hypothetical protein
MVVVLVVTGTEYLEEHQLSAGAYLERGNSTT